MLIKASIIFNVKVVSNDTFKFSAERVNKVAVSSFSSSFKPSPILSVWDRGWVRPPVFIRFQRFDNNWLQHLKSSIHYNLSTYNFSKMVSIA